MEQPFPSLEPANDVGIVFEPQLDDDMIMQLGIAIRDTLAPRGLDHFRRDKGDNGSVSYVHRTGTDKPWWEEMNYQVSVDRMRFMWGPATDPDPARDILQHVATEISRHVTATRLQSYRAERTYVFPTTGNGYERIARAVFANGPVGRLYHLMRHAVPDYRTGDNDIHLIFHLGTSRTGMLQVRGATSRWEIVDDHFEDDPLKLTVGVLDDMPPTSSDTFPQCLSELVQLVQQIDEECVRPTIGVALQAATSDGNGKN